MIWNIEISNETLFSIEENYCIDCQVGKITFYDFSNRVKHKRYQYGSDWKHWIEWDQEKKSITSWNNLMIIILMIQYYRKIQSYGVKKNDILRGMLLCNSTCLRKKIKFANFCIRNYNLTPRDQQNESLDTITLLMYRDSYFNSLEIDTERRVIRFNTSRIWVLICWPFLQIKYKSLNSED